MGSVPGRLFDRHRHRVQLSRARHQVSTGGGCCAVRAQGLWYPVRDVPGRIRGDVFGHHVRLHRIAVLRGELRNGVRPRLGQGRNRHRGAAVHGDACGRQPARRRRKRETQCGTDDHRDHRPADGDPRRVVGIHRRRRRRLLPRRRVRNRGRQERVPRRHRRDVAGVLRDGRFRGLGEHGRGDQGSGARSSRRSCCRG